MKFQTLGTLTVFAMAALGTTCAWAESRAEWGAHTRITATPLADDALTEVSGRGSIDESAVKALQNGAKLSELIGGPAGTTAMLGTAAAESADKQATQTQYKMAMGSAQSVSNTVQLTGVIATVSTPVTTVPLMSLPLFGLPMLPPKSSNDK